MLLRQPGLAATSHVIYCNYPGNYAVGPWQLLVAALMPRQSLLTRAIVFWVLALQRCKV